MNRIPEPELTADQLERGARALRAMLAGSLQARTPAEAAREAYYEAEAARDERRAAIMRRKGRQGR